MSEPAEDPDMREAVNELGDALADALLGASPAEVQRVINAIGAFIDMRIVMAMEEMAGRVAAGANVPPPAA